MFNNHCSYFFISIFHIMSMYKYYYLLWHYDYKCIKYKILPTFVYKIKFSKKKLLLNFNTIIIVKNCYVTKINKLNMSLMLGVLFS